MEAPQRAVWNRRERDEMPFDSAPWQVKSPEVETKATLVSPTVAKTPNIFAKVIAAIATGVKRDFDARIARFKEKHELRALVAMEPRLVVLRTGLVHIKENRRTMLQKMQDAVRDPRAYYRAMEELARVSGHPVHNLGYRTEVVATEAAADHICYRVQRYSCNTEYCITGPQLVSYLKRSIENIETEVVASWKADHAV